MSSSKIKDFFNGRFFEIPKYQRGYAWERQNIRDLFDDINESIASNSNHYIGTIVLSKDPVADDIFYVVDGQQRITTISMIIKCLVNHLEASDKLFFDRFYIKEGTRYRITPLNRDKDFFIAILNGNTLEPQNKSQRALLGAINEIKFYIESVPDKLAFLKSVEKLEVMQFVENSEGDAIRIFQTVNDRGRLLSNTEKVKSLLIYFSNRYLSKELDSIINDTFSEIFEIYDDVKQLGERLNIALIKSKEFDEDSLIRYHFITHSNENYDPSASYVLKYLKNKLSELRTTSAGDYTKLRAFITNYIVSLKSFFEATKSLLNKADSQEKYYKLFSILQLSATIYPLAIRLEMMSKIDLEIPLENDRQITIFDMLELIDVRVYKTRGTDPRADIARFTYEIGWKHDKDILNWLMWFNNRWMSKEQFQASLTSGIYGNRALNHIFINYCETILGAPYTLEELRKISSLTPNIEHILSQTPNFDPIALGFTDEEDYINHEHKIGNLTLLERSLNSSIQNKAAIDKVDAYDRSYFAITNKLGSNIVSLTGFYKKDIIERTQLLSDYCGRRWWCEIGALDNDIKFTVEEDNVVT